MGGGDGCSNGGRGGLEEGGLLAENFRTRTCVPSRRVRKFANYFQFYFSYTIFEEQDWQK